MNPIIENCFKYKLYKKRWGKGLNVHPVYQISKYNLVLCDLLHLESMVTIYNFNLFMVDRTSLFIYLQK